MFCGPDGDIVELQNRIGVQVQPSGAKFRYGILAVFSCTAAQNERAGPCASDSARGYAGSGKDQFPVGIVIGVECEYVVPADQVAGDGGSSGNIDNDAGVGAQGEISGNGIGDSAVPVLVPVREDMAGVLFK